MIEAAYAAEEAGHGAEHGGSAGGLPNPMHQFEIKRLIPFELFGFDASFTNSALFMVIAACVITLFTIYAMRGRALVPTRLQSVAEISYEFVANMVRDNVGTVRHAIFPLRLHAVHVRADAEHARHAALFLHRDEPHHRHLRARRLHLSRRDGDRLLEARVKFLKFFVPSGVPVVMLPLLVVIEVISYLTRPLSLSVRLFANMMAGHTMLKVFGAFVVALGFLGGWAPLAFMVAFTGLEILVAFLQAYVFAILTCIYLNDALHMHH